MSSDQNNVYPPDESPQSQTCETQDDNMEMYLGSKLIKARPMNMAQYFAFKNRQIPEDMQKKFGADTAGYLVEYEPDAGETVGYQSWSPREVFETAYRPVRYW